MQPKETLATKGNQKANTRAYRCIGTIIII